MNIETTKGVFSAEENVNETQREDNKKEFIGYKFLNDRVYVHSLWSVLAPNTAHKIRFTGIDDLFSFFFFLIYFFFKLTTF